MHKPRLKERGAGKAYDLNSVVIDGIKPCQVTILRTLAKWLVGKALLSLEQSNVRRSNF